MTSVHKELLFIASMLTVGALDGAYVLITEYPDLSSLRVAVFAVLSTAWATGAFALFRFCKSMARRKMQFQHATLTITRENGALIAQACRDEVQVRDVLFRIRQTNVGKYTIVVAGGIVIAANGFHTTEENEMFTRWKQGATIS